MQMPPYSTAGMHGRQLDLSIDWEPRLSSSSCESSDESGFIVGTAISFLSLPCVCLLSSRLSLAIDTLLYVILLMRRDR